MSSLFAVSDTVLLHRRFRLRWVRHNSAARFVSLEVTDSTYESIYLVAFILADPVYYNALKNRAALLCRAQRRFSGLCSSTLSVNCEKAEKDTLW